MLKNIKNNQLWKPYIGKNWGNQLNVYESDKIIT